MIELTVRTLDSQNHPFTVEDDITVAQFKQKIAETVNIPAETQRIIYCGRVLTDESKLSEFDVNGKVVHLVERAPPSENQRPNNANRSHSPQPHRVLGGNAMYLGSMAIPLESQNLVPPPPSHSLAASRLNVARRMLRRAEAVINLLENPTARPSDVTPAEEPQEEVTPVFEARVIVPNVGNGPIDEAFVLNTVQNTLISASSAIAGGSLVQGETSTNATASGESPPMPQAEADSETPPARSVSSTPEGVSPISTSTEDLAAESRGATASGSSTLAENASRTSEMADLLDTLSRLQARFAPFLERYQNFMREDPVVSSEDIRRTQAMMNRVSEVLHFLGHAYHSLSDIIIRVRNPPPRPLLCRPILIQHSAVLQAGIPIQVEAQISFAPDGNAAPNAAANSNAAPSAPTTEASNNQTNTAQTPSAQPTQPTQQRANIGQNLNPPFLSFPLLPPSGVHVQSFPIGIRSMRPNSANRQPQNAAVNNNANQNQQQSTPAGNNANSNGTHFSNPNVEFFMEVSPESITIDSLETTLLGGNQGMRAAGAPPPEVLQSIVQIASHLVNRGATNINHNRQPPSTQQTDTTTSQTTSGQSAPTAVPGQNSQARGNTQTHPTTATHTRSTSRPHVHLAQHAMQGFDPFLPCNSHHVSHRRRNQPQFRNNNMNRAQQNSGNAEANQGQVGHPIGVEEIVQDLVNSLQTAYTQGRRQTNVPSGQNQAGQTGQNQSAQAGPNQGAQAGPNQGANQTAGGSVYRVSAIDYSSLPNIEYVDMREVGPRGPTMAQLVPNDNYGEGLFGDLIRFILRNLTVLDAIQLVSGRIDVLNRLRNDIRQFTIDSILEGNPTPANIERGVTRIITEMQPFLDEAAKLPIREDIDIIRSIQMLMRSRLLNILNLAVSRSPNSMKMLLGQLKILIRYLGALILHSNTNGARGFEEFILGFMLKYHNRRDEQFPIEEIRVHLQQFIGTLNIPASSLQVYIVKNVDSVTDYNQVPMDLDPPMNEVNLDQASGSTSVLLNLNDSEDLPSVIVGSEPWHSQVPSDWVPIITRDTQRQRRQNQQSPLSDAYLAGMPSKRRKIVASNKPQGSLPQVIAESIRRAVTASGLSTVGNMEAVAQEAGADLNIQSAYRDLLRTRVQSSIQDNEDFTPDRFPNASNYFNKSQ